MDLCAALNAPAPQFEKKAVVGLLPPPMKEEYRRLGGNTFSASASPEPPLSSRSGPPDNLSFDKYVNLISGEGA